jgi:hypothetical protein
MREFNLEKAKAGKPVCTRDGRNARIICFDAKRGNYPIVALIDDKGVEYVSYFSLDGKYDNGVDSNDLFMASEKHEGWANILVGSACKSDLNRYFSGIFTTKEEAQRYNTDNIVDCVKIEWEE